MSRRRCGARWRVLAWERGRAVSLESDGASVLDELVVDGFVHLEQMAAREWYVRLGAVVLAVTVRADGTARVLLVEGALDDGAAK